MSRVTDSTSRKTWARIRFIKRTQEHGFTLKDIAELLYLQVDSETTCADVKKQADAKIADIEHKIRSLQKMEAALQKPAAAYGENPTPNACAILDYLEIETEGRK